MKRWKRPRSTVHGYQFGPFNLRATSRLQEFVLDWAFDVYIKTVCRQPRLVMPTEQKG